MLTKPLLSLALLVERPDQSLLGIVREHWDKLARYLYHNSVYRCYTTLPQTSHYVAAYAYACSTMLKCLSGPAVASGGPNGCWLGSDGKRATSMSVRTKMDLQGRCLLLLLPRPRRSEPHRLPLRLLLSLPGGWQPFLGLFREW